MHSVAVASAGATPRFASAGAMPRASMCRLAPTEPFIGASRAPTPSAGKLRRRRAAREQTHAGAVQEGGQRQAIEERADEGIERQRLQQVVLEQADEASGRAPSQATSIAPSAMPRATKAARAPISTA